MSDFGKKPIRHIFKILCTGPKNSGVTTLINMYCSQKFTGLIQSTQEVDFYQKKIKIDPMTEVFLQIWALKQNEEFTRLFPDYMENAHALIILFDVTLKQVLKSIKEYIDISRDIVGNIPVFLFGNKNDLENREITQDQLEKFCEQLKCEKSFFISVKTGHNVEEAFMSVANACINNKK